MNSVIVLPEEFSSPASALIEGARAAYLYEFHELRSGLEVRAARLGGLRGRARVLEASPKRVLLDLELKDSPLEAMPLTLIVAVPRPQTVKKVIQIASMLGIEELHFVPSDRSVKSYIQSKTLRPENVKEEIIKGLEQSCDSRPPRVFVWKALWQFMKEKLPEHAQVVENGVVRLLPLTSTASANNLSKVASIGANCQVLCAIGPEAGWSENEEADWLAAGFQPISLGNRMLRVETAVAVLLGQIGLLRCQAAICAL